MTATSSGFIDPIYSLFHVVSQTIPIKATPTPAWANTVPQAERGNPRAPPPALPGEQRPERHRDHQGKEQGREGEIEKWRADRNLVAGQDFQRQRIQRSNEDGAQGGGEERVVTPTAR